MKAMAEVIRQEVFEGKPVRIVSEVGDEAAEWFTAEDIGRALEFSEPRVAIMKLYDRHRDEFEGFAKLVRLVIRLKSGLNLPNRITVFSAEGAYLLTILARTRKSKALRRWLAKFMAQDLHRLKEGIAQAEARILELEESLKYAHISWELIDLQDKVKELTAELEKRPHKALPAPEPIPYDLQDDDEVRVNWKDLRELVDHHRVSRYPNNMAFLVAALKSQDTPDDPDSRQVVAGVQALLKILKRKSG